MHKQFRLFLIELGLDPNLVEKIMDRVETIDVLGGSCPKCGYLLVESSSDPNFWWCKACNSFFEKEVKKS